MGLGLVSVSQREEVLGALFGVREAELLVARQRSPGLPSEGVVLPVG
jgi:hypothetical protein